MAHYLANIAPVGAPFKRTGWFQFGELWRADARKPVRILRFFERILTDQWSAPVNERADRMGYNNQYDYMVSRRSILQSR